MKTIRCKSQETYRNIKTNVQYATNNTGAVQFKWTGTQWQKSWEGEYSPGDWILDL